MAGLVHKEMNNPTVIKKGVQMLPVEETHVAEQPQQSTEEVAKVVMPVVTDVETPVTSLAETQCNEHEVIHEEIGVDIQTESDPVVGEVATVHRSTREVRKTSYYVNVS